MREPVWDHLRSYVVRTGDAGLQYAEELFAAAAQAAADAEFNRVELQLTRIYEVLVQYGDRGRPILDRAATHPHPNVRKPIADAIANLGAGERADLLERLQADPDWRVRAAAIAAYGRLPMLAGRTLQRVLDSLNDPEAAVQVAGVSALMELDPPAQTAGPLLLGILADERRNAEVRGRAAQALGKLGYLPARDALVAAATRVIPDPGERAARLMAIEALGRLGDRSVVGFLITLLDARTMRRDPQTGALQPSERPDQGVVTTAIGALQRLTGHRFRSPQEWKDWYRRR
jgi:HEAT repeat protein